MSIVSTSNPHVRHWKKLRLDHSYRYSCSSLLVAGYTLVSELAGHNAIKALITLPGAPIPPGVAADEHFTVAAAVLKAITGLMEPDGFAAEVAMPPARTLAHSSTVVALDAIADPGNLGTLFRSALALGWEALYLLPGCCDPYNDKALRAGRAAQLMLPHRSGTWEELIALVRANALTPIIAGPRGRPLSQYTPSERMLLILGNEARGVVTPASITWEEVSIPMANTIDSLNVAMAGSILMYALRNRHG